MKPLHRKIIFLLFSAVFLIAAPLIVLYTAGYRYNFQYGRVQKTGILVISSSPRWAQIILNGKMEKKATPARVEKLSAGDYEITLKKTGYHDWRKKLPVHENSTTFAEEVILWKNQTPVKISGLQIQDWLQSPNREKTAMLTAENELISFDPAKEEFTSLTELNPQAEISLLSWSNTGKKILLSSVLDKQKQFSVFDLNAFKDKLKKIPSTGYTKMKWDLKNDNLLYGLNAKGVWEYDLFTNQTKLMSAPVDDFVINGKYIYFLQKQAVVRQTLNNPSEKLILSKKIDCRSCSFINKKNSKLILLDPLNQNLFFLDPENKEKTISAKAKSIYWLKDDVLLFYNDFEMWIFDLNEKKPELVTRLGSSISTALWHPLARHLIFASNGKIRIIELDNRELRFFTTLAETENLTRISLDSKGKNLFFLQKDGVFKLNIR